MLTIKYFWSSSVYVIVGRLLLLCHNLARQKMVCCGAFFPPQFFLVSVWRSQSFLHLRQHKLLVGTVHWCDKR